MKSDVVKREFLTVSDKSLIGILFKFNCQNFTEKYYKRFISIYSSRVFPMKSNLFLCKWMFWAYCTHRSLGGTKSVVLVLHKTGRIIDWKLESVTVFTKIPMHSETKSRCKFHYFQTLCTRVYISRAATIRRVTTVYIFIWSRKFSNLITFLFKYFIFY